MFVTHQIKIAQKDERPHGVLNEVYFQIFLGMGINFRDESNEPSLIMMATVMLQ